MNYQLNHLLIISLKLTQMAQLHVELIFQYIFEGANLVLRRGKFFFFNSWRKFNSSAKHQPKLIATYLAKKKRGGGEHSTSA